MLLGLMDKSIDASLSWSFGGRTTSFWRNEVSYIGIANHLILHFKNILFAKNTYMLV